MTALHAFSAQLAKLGYSTSAIVENYVFPDVLASSTVNRTVALAAFTQTPPSYRNAAIAVIEDAGAPDAAQLVADHRALGAPLLFVIGKTDVAAWQVRSAAPPRILVRAPLSAIDTLFLQHGDQWSPPSIQRAKCIGQIDRTYQLDFVDAGLLPAIEGEIHAKLDRLLDAFLDDVLKARQRRTTKLDERSLFRTTFRLLAAKVLQDRGHTLAAQWDADDLEDVLNRISAYYKLPALSERPAETLEVFGPAWKRLRQSLSFRNISADDLAFVYENTLVTPEARRRFGTHSTPRQLAEYIVGRLELWRYGASRLRIYEPFAGAGVFLVAALRHLREQLPSHWTDAQRHRFLVRRIAGDELDAFACEVARLSLVLADYPNANGWKVHEVDLFADDQLASRLATANVVLCNPPFESFTEQERARYPKTVARSYSKAIAALDASLDAAPLAIGFVLPRPFIAGKQYAGQRRRVEQLYRSIELVELPDGTFNASNIRSTALIAHDRRPTRGKQLTLVRSTVVTQRDRERFLSTGQVTRSVTVRKSSGSSGALWTAELDELWTYLADRPRLKTIARVHRGLEWKRGQAHAVRAAHAPGARLGLLRANALKHFQIVVSPVWLTTQPTEIKYGAHNLPWDKPKVLANAARLSRGPWCFAAMPDLTGLVASQQLYGIWLREGAQISIQQLASFLNGPVANAYLDTHSPPDRIRINAIDALPMPDTLPAEIDAQVAGYMRAAEAGNEEIARKLLRQVDALVLRAYDLPPRLERQLLEHFREATRPTTYPWAHWYPEAMTAAIPLHELISAKFARAQGPWLQDVFRELPLDEATALRDYLD